MHIPPLLKTLNALNAYQINLLQILQFMHYIKTNSDLPTLVSNNKCNYATRYPRNNFKEPKRETNHAKYCIHACGPVIWNRF